MRDMRTLLNSPLTLENTGMQTLVSYMDSSFAYLKQNFRVTP